jgi:hypothetical protein
MAVMGVNAFVGLDPDQVGAMGGDTIRAADSLLTTSGKIDQILGTVSNVAPAPQVTGTLRGVARDLNTAGTQARNQADSYREELNLIELVFPPALFVDPDKSLFSVSNFINPTSDEFGQIPIGLSGFLFSHYGLGLTRPLWLPAPGAPLPTIKVPALFGPDGEVLLTKEIPLLERQFSLQTLRGFRMDPVSVPGWADVASKGLFVVGATLSIFGAADSQWQQDAKEYPHMSIPQRIGSAALTGVMVGGGTAVGGWAGAEVGAEIGAAVCIETGPIALACGAAGALIGGFIGSKLGADVGSGLESAGKAAWHGITKVFSWL